MFASEIAFLLLVTLISYWALRKNWHVHEWGARRTVTWYGPFASVQTSARRCRGCGERSVRMTEGKWTLVEGNYNRGSF